MLSPDLVVHMPSGQPQQLFLLLHGYGSSAADLAPLGRWLARSFTQAAIVSLQVPEMCEAGSGWQWYSLADADGAIADAQTQGDLQAAARAADALRRRGADAALPTVRAQIAQWQAHCQVVPQATLLLGFSQGAGMALEYSIAAAQAAAVAVKPELKLGRVVSVCGRFATLPKAVPERTVYHFVHGADDAVISAHHSQSAGHHLQRLGADAVVDIVEGAGHELSPTMLRLILQRLQTYVPRHVWQEAMGADPALQMQH